MERHMIFEMISTHWISLLQIIWIDLLLSGDNAIVIALACRNLPEDKRKLGMLIGAGVAIGLRILFAVMIGYLLGVPFLKLVGGILLLWIGIKLAMGEDEAHATVESSTQIWKAVKTIAIADAVMSLDNVLAVSAASHGNIWLFTFGILFSIPLIIYGSNVITAIIDRFPVFIWIGAGLLGWIAGEMIVQDPVVVNFLKSNAVVLTAPHKEVPGGIGPSDITEYVAQVIGAMIVILGAYTLRTSRVTP
jgi:YjbE family integral membrane protein